MILKSAVEIGPAASVILRSGGLQTADTARSEPAAHGGPPENPPAKEQSALPPGGLEPAAPNTRRVPPGRGGGLQTADEGAPKNPPPPNDEATADFKMMPTSRSRGLSSWCSRLRALPLFLALASTLPATGQGHPFTTFDSVDPDYVMVAAHRCGYMSNGSITHAENSLSAAQDTIALGVEILETDIKMTSDGGLVLMHDSTVNRTTDGSGTVSAMTLAQVTSLHLLGPGGVTTETVPTLADLMSLVKGHVLVNLDHVNINNTTLRDNIMAVLIATDTVDHAIFKGGASKAQVDAMRAAYPGETIHYMPILSNKSEATMIATCQTRTPPAVELIFNNSSTGMLSVDSQAAAATSDTHIWINSLWSSLCAGHHDAVALGGDPDGSWGWLIDKSCTIIQTDNAPQLIPYLESLGLRGGDPVNRPPMAIAQSASTGKNTLLTISLTGSDPDGDSLTFAVTVDPQHGTLSGLAPDLTYTPDTNYRGPDDFSFKVNDGTVDSLEDALVSITVDPPAALTYDFDDGTMQGWTNTVTGASVFNPSRFDARTEQGRGGGHSPDYSLLHNGNDTWLNGRDIAHDTLVVTSPAFGFDGTSPNGWGISLFLLGGTGNTSAAPASLADLPASTATDGFMGVALRRVSDDAYLLHDRRNATGQYDAWEEQGWSAAEIATAIAGDDPAETYRIDLIDQFGGSWGWIILDTVTIDGVRTPYDNWVLAYLGTSSETLPEDDPDNDACVNLLEYFGGSNPADPASKPLFRIDGFADDDLVVDYHRALDRPDVTGTLQWSTDLGNWHASGENDGIRTIDIAESVISSPGTDPETVEATFQTVSGPPPTRLFVRLLVE